MELRVESTHIQQLICNKSAKEIPCRMNSSTNVSATIGYLVAKNPSTIDKIKNESLDLNEKNFKYKEV